jgi:hypothetical protein
MKHHISTSIIINADIKTVWNIFTDFENYPAWNPLISKIEGPVELNKKFTAQIDGTKFKPMVNVFEPQKELTWTGQLLMTGIFDGTHSFLFKDNLDGTTTLVQEEQFRGILVRLLKKKLDSDIKDKFMAMNEKLKELAEK